MWDGHLNKNLETYNNIEIMEDAKITFQQLYNADLIQRKLGTKEDIR